jgi:hypothetical protein
MRTDRHQRQLGYESHQQKGLLNGATDISIAWFDSVVAFAG